MKSLQPISCVLLATLLVIGRAVSGAPAAAEKPAAEKPVAETPVAETPASAEKPAKADKPRVVIGRVEFVVVRDVNLRLKARIDTGAGVSSINAKILEIKKTPDGEQVKFQVTDDQGVTKTLERQVIGWSQIKVMSTNQMNRRPIVELRICLGGKKLKGRVNLTDRSAFLYPVLIGRNLLNTGKFLVDPSEKFLVEPNCD